MRRSMLAMSVVLGCVVACSAKAPSPPEVPKSEAPKKLTVSNAAARISGEVASVYFRIENPGETDVLESADVPRSDMAMLHESVVKNGVALMEHRDSVVIPARSTVEFKEGGLHVMVVGLVSEGPPKALPVILKFKRAGEVRLEAPARHVADAAH